MKNGKTPIHIQRWAPADYHDDDHVRVLKARRDWVTLTFYRHFIDKSFMAGGSLPADLESLSAAVEMPKMQVERALRNVLGKLVHKIGNRLFQNRVRRDVLKELRYRRSQSVKGSLGGRPRVAFNDPSQSQSPPTPTPTPTPHNETPPLPSSVPEEGMVRPGVPSEKEIRKTVEDLSAFWIKVGGHPMKDTRRSLREYVKGGFDLETIRELIAVRVFEELQRSRRPYPETLLSVLPEDFKRERIG